MYNSIYNLFSILIDIPYNVVNAFNNIMVDLISFDLKTFDISLRLFSDNPIFEISGFDLFVVLFSFLTVYLVLKWTVRFFKSIFRLVRWW